MAAYTDNHHSYHLSLSQGLSTGTQHHNQDVSISGLVDHGSISFGRFGGESLAWEKWSVFSHNRCQEELEKFKAPGLVAQKKAFFEDYYKKIRAMKKLQAEQQEIEKSKLSEESHTFTHVETSDGTMGPEEEQNCSNSVQTLCSSDEQLFQNANANGDVINISRDETETSSANFVEDEPGWNPSDYFINRDDIKSFSAPVVDEEQHQNPYWDIIKGDDIEVSSATIVDGEPSQNPNCDVIQDETKTSLATIVNEKPGQNPNYDILINRDDSETSSVANVEKTFVKSSLQSRSKDLTVLSKAKATVTSSRDKMKLHYRSRKDDTVKPSEKLKGSLGKSTSKVLGEKANPKQTEAPKSHYVSSHRLFTNVRSSVIESQISGTKSSQTSSHSVRSGLPKANSSSVSKDRPTSSHSVRSGAPKANITSISVTKDKPITPLLSIRQGMPKANLRSNSVSKERPTSSHSIRPSVSKAGLNSVSVTVNRPSSSSGVRSSVHKANSNLISVTRDRPTSSHGVKSGFPKANLYAPLFVKSGPVKANFSSYSMKTTVPKENLNSKGSINKFHDTSRPKTVTNSVDNLSSGRRSHVGFVGMSLETVPKRVLPEIQKPKIGLTSSPARIKSKQNPVNDSGVKNNINNGGSKTKILAWQSADMSQTRKELIRPKTPGWR